MSSADCRSAERNDSPNPRIPQQNPTSEAVNAALVDSRSAEPTDSETAGGEQATASCSICSGSAHDETYRCETCGAEFTCPSTFLKMPTPTAEITAHRTIPVLGFLFNPDGTGPWPQLGEEVTCGPVYSASKVQPSKTQRGLELARAQQRREGLVVLGERRWRDFEDTLKDAP